jgi:hypothetical protein
MAQSPTTTVTTDAVAAQSPEVAAFSKAKQNFRLPDYLDAWSKASQHGAEFLQQVDALGKAKIKSARSMTGSMNPPATAEHEEKVAARDFKDWLNQHNISGDNLDKREEILAAVSAAWDSAIQQSKTMQL